MIVRSLLFYVAFYGGSTFMVIYSGLLVLFAPDRLYPLTLRWTAYHMACARVILNIDMKIEGKPVEGPALYAFKHQSFYEALNLPQVLDRPVPFAKAELFRIPIWGAAAKRYGLVPVARGKGVRSLRRMLEAASARAKEGRPLVIFPEGTRVPHGQRSPLRAGFFGLYKHLNLPVVPVAVNSGPYYQPWLKKRSGTITLRIMDPIAPGLPRAEIEMRVQDAMNALNQESASSQEQV